MSHFTVLVIGDNVEKALQPFHEYECTGIEDEYVKFVEAEENLEEKFEKYKKEKEEAGETCSYDTVEDYAKDWYGYYKNEEGKWGRKTNPNAKWDWWQLGGRWSGEFFILKHGAVGGIVGQPGVFGNKTGIDSIKLKDVDWEAMRKRGEDQAKEYWEKLEKAFDGEIPIPKVAWMQMHELDEYKDWDIEKKREFYHAQPEVVKQNEVSKKQEYRDLFGWGFDLNSFACGKEEYIRKRGESALSTFALVANGKWYERGEMGWFACVSNEKDEESWHDEFSSIIAQCDEDEQVSLVDCHI